MLSSRIAGFPSRIPRRRARRHLSPSAWRRRAALRVSFASHRRVQRDRRRGDRHPAGSRQRSEGRLSRSGVGVERQRNERISRDGRGTAGPVRARLQPASNRAGVVRVRVRGASRGDVPRHPGRRVAHRGEHPRRADRVQRELAGQRAAVAADDRPSVRQGDRRIHRDRAGALPDRGKRPPRRGSRPPRQRAAHALEAIGPDRIVALRARDGPVRRAPLRRGPGHPSAGLVLSAGPRQGLRALPAHGPPRVRVLQRLNRSVLLREARSRRGGRPQRRHRARVGDLLRREGGCRRTRPRGARGGSPVVGQRRHRKGLGRRLAERRVCDLLHTSLRGAVQRTRRLRARVEDRRQRHPPGPAQGAGSACHPSQPGGHAERAEPLRLPERRLGAPHAPRGDRNREVLGGHSGLLPAVPQPQRVHRRSARR